MVLVEVSPEWDISAKKMETETFPDAKVQELLQQAVLVKINPEVSDNAKMMATRMKVLTYPTVLILNYKGIVVARATGFQDAVKFTSFLSQNVELFQENPLGPAQVDLTPDNPLVKAEKLKPDNSELPPHTLYYDLLLHEEMKMIQEK